MPWASSQTLAPILQFCHEDYGPGWIVLLDVTADRNEVRNGLLPQNHIHDAEPSSFVPSVSRM